MINMEKKKLMAVIEAVLFTMGSAVEKKKLAETADTSENEIEDALSAIRKKYDEEDSGITLITLEDKVQLCTKTELYEYLIKIAKAPRTYVLTDTVLETLSIIAYKQPVTKMQIEHIRGVSAEHAIDKLLEYDLVKELGRLDAPGRPLLFGTTEEFLRAFGVKSLDELPEVKTDEVESFRFNVQTRRPALMRR